MKRAILCCILLFVTDFVVAAVDYQGTGSPEGVVTASPGALYLRTDGGSGTTLYIKVTSTDTSGWVALDDVPESGDFSNLTGGAGVQVSSGTVSSASTEAAWLTDGGIADLNCGTSNQGKAAVMNDGTLQYCDGATTSVRRFLHPVPLILAGHDPNVGVTFTVSGLEDPNTHSGQLALFQNCPDGSTYVWNEASTRWECGLQSQCVVYTPWCPTADPNANCDVSTDVGAVGTQKGVELPRFRGRFRVWDPRVLFV